MLEIIKTEFEEIEVHLEGSTPIRQALSLNSMNTAILLTCIELDFDVALSNSDLNNCQTFQDLYDLIKLNKSPDA